MEQSFDLSEFFEQPREESSLIVEEDESEEESSDTEVANAFQLKPWYHKQRKTIVRMIGSSLIWQSSDRRKRRFRDRSIVRMMASRLPLKPSKRAYFEIFVESNKQVINRAKDFFEENLNTVKSKLPEMGLADMDLFTWNDFDDESQEAKPGIITRGAMETSSHSLSSISNISTEDAVAPPPRCLKRGKKVRVKEASENKITALEDELANLRSQIAMIVSLQEKASEPAAPVPPPPPPPMIPATPPPPPMLPVSKSQRRTNKANVLGSKAAENKVPSMSDVLVGLSTVKLRPANISRSPGGTPMKPRSRSCDPSSQDPADVIANALRKKFAKARKSIESPSADKENQLSPHGGFSPSPTKCVETPTSLPITSSPEKSRKSRRRSGILTGNRLVLSPVFEN